MLLLSFFCGPQASAAELPEGVQVILDSSPITQESFLSLTPTGILAILEELLRANIAEPLLMGRKIILYLFLWALLASLLNEQYRKQLETVCVAVLLRLILAPSVKMLGSLAEQAERWNVYMGMMIPVQAGLIAASGYISSAAVYSAAFVGASNLFAAALKLVLMPLIRLYIGLAAMESLWERKGFSLAGNLLLKGTQLLFKGLAVALGMLLGAQSLLAGEKDTLALKAGKFLLANSIPIVGEAASDALGTAIAGLRMVKSSVAFAAMASIFMQSAPIILETGLFCGVIYISAAIAEGVGLKNSAKAILALYEGLRLCLSVLAIYFLLLFFCTVYMVILGG